ncbi:hypothetical protein N9C98_01200 [Synechococcus sp. AH-224-G16]|nr:hypothetical protein [Synechococcus sp. AH-224-G16]
MHPILNKYIKNNQDVLAIELFASQNKTNNWVSATTVAAWMNQTNNPTGQQIHRASKLLSDLSTCDIFGDTKDGILEKRTDVINYQRHGKQMQRMMPVYRLVNTMHIAPADTMTVQEAITDALTEAKSKMETVSQRKLELVDDLPF